MELCCVCVCGKMDGCAQMWEFVCMYIGRFWHTSPFKVGFEV